MSRRLLGDAAAGPAVATGPTARLSARRTPHRRAVRTVRLSGAPGELVLTDAAGRRQGIPVGPDGVTAAAHVGGPLLAEVAPGSLGAVDLLRADGSRHARLALVDWVPEAAELASPDEALELSGLREVLEAAGLGLAPVPPSRLAEALDADPAHLGRPEGALPAWFTVLRTAAVAVAVLAAGVGLVGSGRAGLLLVVASALLAISAVTAAGLWLHASLRDRDPGGPSVVPHPAVPVPRRFRRVARLRVEADEVVVVDALGTERRLPRSGRHAVERVEVVRPGTARGQVELVTADGRARATLPWDLWCAGDDGAAVLAACRHGGLPVVRPGTPARRSWEQEERTRAAWAPAGPAEVRAALDAPPGLPGQAATVQTSALALLLLLVAVVEGFLTAAALCVLTLVLSAGLPLGRELGRRLWLDRPA